MANSAIPIPASAGRLAIGLVLLAALTATWTGIKLPSGGAPADILIVLSLGVVAVMVVFGELRFALPYWPVFPCLAIAVCVLIRQIDPAPAYMRVLQMQIYGQAPNDITKALFWIFAIVLVPSAVVACAAIDRRSTEWIMGAFVTGAAISSGVAVTDLVGLTPNIGRTLGEATQICSYTCFNAGLGGRMNGLADHPNTLGMTATISISIAMYFLAKNRHKWIGAVALVVLFGGILASGSRAAQAVAPVCALAGMFLIPRGAGSRGINRTVTVLGCILGGLVILVALPDDMRQRLFRIFDTSGSAFGSDSERFKLLQSAVADWHAHPVFGSGIRHIVEAHNIYLQFLASGGVVLALAMLIYFFLVLRQSWILSRQGVLMARFLILSVVTWLVLGLVLNAVTDRYLYYTIGCIAALGWARSIRAQGADEPPASSATYDTRASI